MFYLFLFTKQRCKSGRDFRVGFGPKVDKISGLIRAWDVLFVKGAQKYNQNNLATLPNEHFIRAFFWHDLGLKLVFGFGPELVGPFTTLSRKVLMTAMHQPYTYAFMQKSCLRHCIRGTMFLPPGKNRVASINQQHFFR